MWSLAGKIPFAVIVKGEPRRGLSRRGGGEPQDMYSATRMELPAKLKPPASCTD